MQIYPHSFTKTPKILTAAASFVLQVKQIRHWSLMPGAVLAMARTLERFQPVGRQDAQVGEFTIDELERDSAGSA